MDATELQKLIDDAPNHGRVRIPAGHHVLGRTLEVRDKSLRIRARGAVLTCAAPVALSLQSAPGTEVRYGLWQGLDKPGDHYSPPASGDYHPIFSVLDSDRVRIRDLTITDRTHGVSALRSHNLQIHNLQFHGVVSPTTVNANWFPAIHTLSDYTNIDTCEIYDTGSGVLVGSPARYTTIRNVLVDGFRDNGLYLSTSLGAMVDRCRVRRGWEGSSSGIKNHGSLLTVEDCEVQNCNNGIVLLGSNSHGYEAATDQTVRRNKIHGCRAYGISVSQHGTASADGAHAICERVAIMDNEIVRCGLVKHSAVRLVSGTSRPLTEVEVEGNVIYKNYEPQAPGRWYAVLVTGSYAGADLVHPVMGLSLAENQITGTNPDESIGARIRGVRNGQLERLDSNEFRNCQRDYVLQDAE